MRTLNAGSFVSAVLNVAVVALEPFALCSCMLSTQCCFDLRSSSSDYTGSRQQDSSARCGVLIPLCGYRNPTTVVCVLQGASDDIIRDYSPLSVLRCCDDRRDVATAALLVVVTDTVHVCMTCVVIRAVERLILLIALIARLSILIAR